MPFIWPRTILPERVSPLTVPGPYLSIAQSGKMQVRDQLALGREWTETYSVFSPFSPEGRELLGRVHHAWRTGDTFTISHRFYEAPSGSGTGSPVVNGGGQSGTTLSTRSWTGGNPVLRIGDVFRVAGVPYLLECTENATNLVAGVSTLTFSPPILPANAPVDGAALTYVNPTLTARLIERPDLPEVDSEGLIMGMRLVFKEVV